MNVNDRIKQVRLDSGLSQVAFAERIGIGSSAMSKLEKGENNPSDQTIKLICSEFGVNRDWLETGDGEKKAASSGAAMVARVMMGDNDYAKSVMAAFAALGDDEWQALRVLVDKLKKAGL